MTTATTSTVGTATDTSEHYAWSKVPQVTIAFWIVKIFVTTVGETGGDARSMTLNLGYVVSTLIFVALFAIALAAQVKPSRYHPVFYSLLVRLRFERGALVFAALLALIVALHFCTSISTSVLFWAAYLLTRPLGATLGHTLTKPPADGGLNFGRITSSLVIAAGMVVLITITSVRHGASISPAAAAH